MVKRLSQGHAHISPTPNPTWTKPRTCVALDLAVILGGPGQGHSRSKVILGQILTFEG